MAAEPARAQPGTFASARSPVRSAARGSAQAAAGCEAGSSRGDGERGRARHHEGKMVGGRARARGRRTHPGGPVRVALHLGEDQVSRFVLAGPRTRHPGRSLGRWSLVAAKMPGGRPSAGRRTAPRSLRAWSRALERRFRRGRAASGGRGAPQARQIPARLRGRGAGVRPRRVPLLLLPPRAAHGSRVASLMQPPPPRRASGFRASSGPRASSEFLLGQRPQTRSYYCSRARSAFPPPPPLARPASLPLRAGRLIPRCTAGFLGETARAAWLAPRAASGCVLPQQRSQCPAGGSAFSEDARRLLSFVLGRELPGVS